MTFVPNLQVEAEARAERARFHRANTRLVAKAISEYSHERLLFPVTGGAGDGAFALVSRYGDVRYDFRGRRFHLDHLWVASDSLRRTVRGEESSIDAVTFFSDFADELCLTQDFVGEFIEEVCGTVAALLRRDAQPAPGVPELVCQNFQAIEVAMDGGHPCFVVNHGRLGFDLDDRSVYAPEAGCPTELLWLAVRHERTLSGCLGEKNYDSFIRREIGPRAAVALEDELQELGFIPADYLFIPVHPWQWENRIAQLYAGEVARAEIVLLAGTGKRYQAQQSIRTFFPTEDTRKHYAKTALSIVNMGFTRGLAPNLGDRGVCVNAWVSELVESDQELSTCGFRLLREVAFAGVPHLLFEVASKKRVAWEKEMLAVLFRENPLVGLAPGETVMTMAALLHVDHDGRSFLAALIGASGCDAETWLRRYLVAYLRPLLHAFYAHHLVFTPHGENTLLRLRNGVPVGVFMKDLAEDIGVMNPRTALPESVACLALRVPEHVMPLAIFTDVFDCFFRHMTPLLELQAGIPEERFWQLVADCLVTYQTEHAELAGQFRRYDLFSEEFPLNCLNRLQLKNHREMVDMNADEPADSLQFVGSLRNPIARFAPPSSRLRAGEPTHVHT
jgi:siderophore synthetase component